MTSPVDQLQRFYKALLQRKAAPVRVLIADDESDTRELLVNFLLKWGIEVYESFDGASSIAAMSKAGTIDLALVDLRMPTEEHGMQIMRELRHHDISSSICVFSGYFGQDLGRIIHKIDREIGCVLIRPKPSFLTELFLAQLFASVNLHYRVAGMEDFLKRAAEAHEGPGLGETPI